MNENEKLFFEISCLKTLKQKLKLKKDENTGNHHLYNEDNKLVCELTEGEYLIFREVWSVK